MAMLVYQRVLHGLWDHTGNNLLLRMLIHFGGYLEYGRSGKGPVCFLEASFHVVVHHIHIILLAYTSPCVG